MAELCGAGSMGHNGRALWGTMAEPCGARWQSPDGRPGVGPGVGAGVGSGVGARVEPGVGPGVI